MIKVNMLLVKPADKWTRIIFKARRDMRKRGDLHEAVRQMREEQRADGIARGVLMCDVPWCAEAATHSWTRTAKETKAMTVKVRGQKVTPLETACRCEKHLPHFAPEWLSRYQPINPAAVSIAA